MSLEDERASGTPRMAPPAPDSPIVHLPVNDEVIFTPNFSMRFLARAELGPLEVRIDDGPWRPCGEYGGYWWYKWSDYASGPHVVEAKCTPPGGLPILSPRRRFTVRLYEEEEK